MRRQFGSWLVAGFMALLSAASATTAGPAVGSTEGLAAGVPISAERTVETDLRDEAAMILVGTMLIGIAAVVRRTS